MDKKVLVTYATKYGSTADIAARIGQVLSEAGLQNEVLPVNNTANSNDYDAIVLGSAVYDGQWRKEVAAFLKSNEQVLTGKPIWLFSSGPTGEGDPVEFLQGWRYPASLQPVIEHIKPRDITVFHGNIDISRLNFIQKLSIKNVKAPIGDFRKWDDVNAWANSIADSLKK
jgi:menaquinone-dependent protoporphyrinogen oxidase